jgi:hypothetical protein
MRHGIRQRGGVEMASRSHRTRVLGLTLSVSATVLLWVLPAVAGACSISDSKLNGVKSFSGTASEEYASGTVVWTPPILPGGTSVTYTESMNRQASKMQLADLTQADQSSGTFSNAKMPSGGAVTIDDTYSDTLGGVATQTASGPTIAGGGNGGEGAQIYFDTAAPASSRPPHGTHPDQVALRARRRSGNPPPKGPRRVRRLRIWAGIGPHPQAA